MTRFAAYCLFVLCPALCWSGQAPATADGDGEIQARAQLYCQALEEGNAKLLDDLMLPAGKVQYPMGDGRKKPELMKDLAKTDAGPKRTPAKVTLSGIEVRRAGDTAVVSTISAFKSENEPEGRFARTLVWAREDGRWRLLHDQWRLLDDAGQAAFWSGFFRQNFGRFNHNPNALLVRAVEGVRPGQALDVGMGQGRNALYLAKQGWQVTGIDRAEGALAVTRQQAIKQGLKITPILQTAEEFDWGQQRWDLVALLYVDAVRANLTKIRESLKPGGLVVVEAFLQKPGVPGKGVMYAPGEMRKLFQDGFEVRIYEEQEGIADYGQNKEQLVRIVARRTAAKPH